MDIILSSHQRMMVKAQKAHNLKTDRETDKLATGKISHRDNNAAYLFSKAQSLEDNISEQSVKIKNLRAEKRGYDIVENKIATAISLTEEMRSLTATAAATNDTALRASYAQSAQSLWSEMKNILQSTIDNEEIQFQTLGTNTPAPPPPDSTLNLLSNASFEDTSGGTGSGASVLGWTHSTEGIGLNPALATDGSYSIPLGGWTNNDVGSFIEQTIATNAGSTYDLSYDAGIIWGSGAGTIQVSVTDGSGNILHSTTHTDTTVAQALDSYSADFTATDGSATLRFELISKANATVDFTIDNTSIVETSRVDPTQRDEDILEGTSYFSGFNPQFGWSNAATATWATDAQINADAANFQNIVDALESYSGYVNVKSYITSHEIDLVNKDMTLSQNQIDNMINIDLTEQSALVQSQHLQQLFINNLNRSYFELQQPMLTTLLQGIG